MPPPPPPPAAAPAKAVSTEEAPRFTLLGIIRAPDGGGSAVMMDDTVRASFSLKPGEGRRGWIVRSIDPDAVVLAKGQQTVRLAFLKSRNAPRAPAE